jgi:hypothetical protein
MPESEEFDEITQADPFRITDEIPGREAQEKRGKNRKQGEDEEPDDVWEEECVADGGIP